MQGSRFAFLKIPNAAGQLLVQFAAVAWPRRISAARSMAPPVPSWRRLRRGRASSCRGLRRSQEPPDFGFDARAREIVLNQFGDDLAARDEIHHGQERRANHAAQNESAWATRRDTRRPWAFRAARLLRWRCRSRRWRSRRGQHVVRFSVNPRDGQAGPHVTLEKLLGNPRRCGHDELRLQIARETLRKHPACPASLGRSPSGGCPEGAPRQDGKHRARGRREIPRGSSKGARRPPADGPQNPQEFPPRCRCASSNGKMTRTRARLRFIAPDPPRPPSPDLRRDEINDRQPV